MSALELARAAFRDGARALEPETFSGTATPQVVRAWLCIQTVRTQPKWVRAAADAVQDLARDLDSIPNEEVADWVEACCRGWVQQAIGPFRNAARLLLPRLADEFASVPALLGWWRITGERAPLHRALTLLDKASAGAPSDSIALRLGYQATADEGLRRRGVEVLGGELSQLPVTTWGAAADLLDLDVDAFAGPLDQLQIDSVAAAAAAVPAMAALALPPLVLEAQWWMEDELREGPMAEAATFPWPALRLRFTRLSVIDQIHFEARFAGGAAEELEDVGVVSPWLESIVARTDRGPLLDGAPPRMRRKGGLRR